MEALAAQLADHDLLEIDGVDVDVDAEHLDILNRPHEFGRVQQYLRRDTTPRKADTSRRVFVDHCNAYAGVSLNHRAHQVHRRTRADRYCIVPLQSRNRSSLRPLWLFPR